MKKTINVTKDVAVHVPSGCTLINGEWQLEATLEDIFLGGSDDFGAHSDIIDKGDEGYDEDDIEQERSEDYRIETKKFTIVYDENEEDELYDLYTEQKSDGTDFADWLVAEGYGALHLKN